MPFARAYYTLDSPTGHVSDFAGILNTQEKTDLENKLTKLNTDTSVEVAVVTIKSLEGDTIENFAVKLFEEWKIGKKSKDNGVLFLIALNNRKMRIEVGYGLEPTLTDAHSSWIIQNVGRYFKLNKYGEGIIYAVSEIDKTLRGNSSPETQPENGPGSQRYKIENIFLNLGLVVAYFFLRFGIRFLGMTKSWWLGGVIGAAIGYLIGGLLFAGIFTVLGLLLDYIFSKNYDRWKGSGHGSWFGGSGSSSGGGGFGGFGGGRSGGGGSSGSW